MRHSMSKDIAFNGETTPRHTFLCSDSQCLPPGDPRILCAKNGSPITGKSFVVGCSLKSFRSLARDCFATLPKVNVKAKISELQPGIILFVMNISIDSGFHSDVIKLRSQNSEVLRILIYTRSSLRSKRFRAV